MPALVFTVCACIIALVPVSLNASAHVSRTEIDELAGPSVAVTSINDRGAIVGSIAAVPFRWTHARGVEFFLGSSPGQATDINDRGDIVGYLEQSQNSLPGFLWTKRDGLTDLDTFLPLAINNRGQVAGMCAEDLSTPRPCIWENGVLTELGDGVVYGAAHAINARGEVAGQIGLSAFVWSPRTGLVLLPNVRPGSNDVQSASGLNNRGQVVGIAADASSPIATPVRWRPSGEAEALSQFQGTEAVFIAINASGLAIGRYLVQVAPTEFVWHGFASVPRGHVTTLGLGIPVAVNNRGAILGTTNVDGVQRVVIWRVVK